MKTERIEIIRPRSMSMEFMVPEPSDISRVSGVLTSSLVLLSTMVGGGMLTLPYAYSQMGLMGGILMQLTSCVAAGFSLYILIASARRTGASSYASVAADAYGTKAASAVTVLTLLLVFMVMVAYDVLMHDLVETLLEFCLLEFGAVPATPAAATNAGLSVGDDDVVAGAAAAAATARAAAAMAAKGNWVLLGLLVVVALPLSLHKSLGSLAFVTSASLGSMVVLTVAVAVRGGGHAATHWDSLEYRWWPRQGDAAAAVLRSLPIFTLSYMCHFNALSMHAELMNPTRARLKAVIGVTLGVSTAMYIVFGVFGYLWAGDGTQGDVLAAFPANDTFINIGRVGLGVALLCNVPMCVLPMREILHQLFKDSSNSSAPGTGTGKNNSSLGSGGKSGSSSNSDDIELPNSALEMRYSVKMDAATALFSSASPSYDAVDRFDAEADSSTNTSSDNCGTLSHVLLTLLLLLLPFGVATGCPGVEVVWGLCGSSVGVLLALTFPAGIYLKLRGHKGVTFDFRSLDFSPVKRSRCKPQENHNSSVFQSTVAPERAPQGLLGGGIRMGSTVALLLGSLAILVACTWASLAAESPAAAAAKAAG